MRRFIAAVAVLLVLAGCTSGDTKTTSGGSSTTTRPGATTTLEPAEVAKAPGVTDNAIKLGITYVDLAAIGSVTTIDHGDYEAAYQAVIDDLNARGGINGRKIEPVFAPVNPIGTQPADEACLKLTEDDKVFAITGFFLGDAVLCPLESHDTAVLGGEMNPERLDRAAAPWFTVDPGSDLQSDAISAFADKGLLDGKLAVFAQNTDVELLESTVEPLLDELGIKPVSTAVLDVPADDVTAAVAQAAVIAQKFKSTGATKVLVIGNGGVAWAQGLETTDYRPENIFTTTNSILAYAGDAAGRDLSVLAGAIAGDIWSRFQAVRGAGHAEVPRRARGRRHRGEGPGHPRGRRARGVRVGSIRLPVHRPVRSDRQGGRQGPQLRHVPDRCGEPRRGQAPRLTGSLHVRQPTPRRRRPRRLRLPLEPRIQQLRPRRGLTSRE